MKTVPALAFAMLLSTLMAPLPSAAYGAACPRGCARQAKACVQTAHVRLRGCLAECRTTAAGRDCASACSAAFRAAKAACSADRASCVGLCNPPPPTSCAGAFLDTCGQELGVCAREVVTRAKQCVRGCKGVSDPVGCLAVCAAAAQTGTTQCAADFGTCVGRCRPPATTTTTTLPGQPCTSDAQCDDGNGCTVDRCMDGTCEHACVCLDATGAVSCCPGPAALCARPCGVDAGGVCGGACPTGATCENLPTAATPTCGCVSGLGGPCGGNIVPDPPVCGPGLVCRQSTPDAVGVCVQATCIPFFANGCTETSDCCDPCTVLGRAPCAVCLQGQCVGTP